MYILNITNDVWVNLENSKYIGSAKLYIGLFAPFHLRGNSWLRYLLATMKPLSIEPVVLQYFCFILLFEF